MFFATDQGNVCHLAALTTWSIETEPLFYLILYFFARMGEVKDREMFFNNTFSYHITPNLKYLNLIFMLKPVYVEFKNLTGQIWVSASSFIYLLSLHVKTIDGNMFLFFFFNPHT